MVIHSTVSSGPEGNQRGWDTGHSQFGGRLRRWARPQRTESQGPGLVTVARSLLVVTADAPGVPPAFLSEACWPQAAGSQQGTVALSRFSQKAWWTEGMAFEPGWRAGQAQDRVGWRSVPWCGRF